MPLKKIHQAPPQPTPVEPPSPRQPTRFSPRVPANPKRIEQEPTIPVRFTEDIDYPDYDGLPMADNTDQAQTIVDNFQTLRTFFWGRNDVFVATNLLVYYREGDNTTRITPDVMVAFGRPPGYRGSYKVWEEGNHPPDWVLEVASEGTADVDVFQKPGIYAGIGVSEYWQYDPTGGLLNPRLQGWRLTGLKYAELPQVPVAGAEIAIYSEVLGLRLEFDVERLRFWDPVGEQYLRTPLESEHAALEGKQDLRESDHARREAEQGQREERRRRREAEQSRRESDRLVLALKARAEAAEHRVQVLEALIADLPAGSRPPDDSED